METEERDVSVQYDAAVQNPIALNGPLKLEQRLQLRRKVFMLLFIHLQNFQRVVITNRRRFQQRMKRRQAMLRTFYIQQIMEIETSFVELLPIPSMLNMPTCEKSKQNEKEPAVLLRFYEDIVTNFSEKQWLDNFRMTKKTFYWLCGQLSPVLQSNNKMLYKKVILEKRIALALYVYSTGKDYRLVAKIFNITRVSALKFIKRFAKSLLEKLGNALISMPKNDDEYEEIRLGFQQVSNMPPLVIGVLGICKIPLIHNSEPTNETKRSSITLQTIIDDKLLFRKVKMDQDSPSLCLDTLNEITTLKPQLINERYLPCFLVTPSALYPLQLGLMQSYVDPVEPHEYDFNEAVENLVVIGENAFRRLFARWKILNQINDFEPMTMELILTACCALHNLLEEHEEGFLNDWTKSLDMLKFSEQLKATVNSFAKSTDETLEIRDFLARTISSTEI